MSSSPAAIERELPQFARVPIMMPFDRTEPFGGWDDGLPVWPDDVLRRWWACLATEPPWRDMPADDAFGCMRRILSELLNEARDIDHESRQSRLQIAARAHGAFRREQLCGLTDLACELEAVVAAINAALCDSGQAESTTRDSVHLLASGLQLAQAAAVEGWNRAPLSAHRRVSHDPDRFVDGFE